MINVTIEIATMKRPLSPGTVRTLIHARDENDQPVAVFLCSIEPPNTFERVMRESFVTVCSVEDMVEYPVGVSSITEVDPASCENGVFLYAAQANKVYIRDEEDGQPVWKLYQPQGKHPNTHTHKLPFFRRSSIDIILPHREFVLQSLEWIRDAVKRLEKDQYDLEQLKPYTLPD
jgi:hypothetical protein